MTRSNEDAKVESGVNGAQNFGDSMDASLCENLCTLRKKTTSAAVFLTKSIALITASIGWTVLLIVLPLLPLAGLIIGAIHKNDCPAEDKIPMWLVIWSSTLIMRKVIALGCKQCKESVQESSWTKVATWIIDTFILVWFVCGSAWVFGVYKPEYEGDELNENYCHPVLYIFCFVIQIIVYIMFLIIALVILAICLVCTSACCGIVAGVSDDNNAKPTTAEANAGDK